MKKISEYLQCVFATLLLTAEIIGVPIIFALAITSHEIDGFVKLITVFLLAIEIVIIYAIILDDILKTEDKK